MKVKFSNLGANKANFTAEMSEINFNNLYNVVRPYLHSSVIDFDFDTKGKTGTVFVGLVRPVGTFTVED